MVEMASVKKKVGFNPKNYAKEKDKKKKKKESDTVKGLYKHRSLCLWDRGSIGQWVIVAANECGSPVVTRPSTLKVLAEPLFSSAHPCYQQP